MGAAEAEEEKRTYAHLSTHTHTPGLSLTRKLQQIRTMLENGKTGMMFVHRPYCVLLINNTVLRQLQAVARKWNKEKSTLNV